MAEPILLMLFPAREAEAIASAPTLMAMAVGIVFLSSVQTLTGVLQGIGKQSIPVRNLAIGAVFKLAVTYICVGIPEFNVRGAAFGSIAAYLVATLLDMMAVKKYTGIHFDLGLVYIKPFIASALMGAGTFAAYKLLFMITDSNGLSTLLSICVAVVIYAVLILVMKAITKEEIAKMPKGDKLVRILDKFIK